VSGLPPVVRARWGEIDAITTLLTKALHSVPASVWLVPDERRRPAVLAGSLRILVEHALMFGEVHLLDDWSAAAVWFHRYRPIPPPASYERRLAAACGSDVDRFLSLDKTFDIHHPTENHYHLAFLAVAPEMRHTGRANALLNHHHQRLDSLGQPAYAEAASTEGRDLLAWHGYRPRQPFTLPDSGGRIYPMWRSVAVPGSASRADEPVHPAD
jgi:GNAT superfamily N-acetyltransferase